MENIIEVRNLKYKYDSESENYTLNDVSFQIKKGEWLSIVGHNGSGKSTTVRLIDSLLEAESRNIITILRTTDLHTDDKAERTDHDAADRHAGNCPGT